MPRYQYKCGRCKIVFERDRGTEEAAYPSRCFTCKGMAKRIYISPPAYSIKGLKKDRFHGDTSK